MGGCEQHLAIVELSQKISHLKEGRNGTQEWRGSGRKHGNTETKWGNTLGCMKRTNDARVNQLLF